MRYQTIPFDKRIKENIRNYSLSHLFDMETVKGYLVNLAKLLEVNILLTDRHGEKEIVIGDSFLGFKPDVVKEPGYKLRVRSRTVGHLYIRDLAPSGDKKLTEEMVESTLKLLERLGEEVYLRREGSIYMEELERELADRHRQSVHGEHEDMLTGLYNKNYFDTRMNIVDRSGVVPVAVINVNINDWKFVNDHFGQEESDRLIRVVADILKEEARADFVIGRIDGDVFGVLVPLSENSEVEEFVARVQDRCFTYDDPILAPSVAVGVVYKTNIEETLEDRMSDAEYEMFSNKFEIKNSPGYRERLERGI